MSHSDRQLAFVIDLNKCMGCGTCVIGCKVLWSNDKGMDHQWWMKVNSMPGRGYPRDWEQMGGGYDSGGAVVLGRVPAEDDYGTAMEFNYEDAFFGGADPPRLAPVRPPGWGPNWDEDVGGGEWPNAYLYYLPRMCNQCSRPSCVAACPLGAISKRQQDGVVEVVDPRACEGCAERPCMAACPYKEVFHNPLTGHAQKCHACLPRTGAGVAPACVRMCPGRCIWVDYIDNESGPVYQLVRKWEVALPLHPEFNNEPNVYYVPPLSLPKHTADGSPDIGTQRIPIDHLRALFGPGVDRALETLVQEMAKRRADPKQPSELMDVLIARRWQSLLGPFPGDPAEAEVA